LLETKQLKEKKIYFAYNCTTHKRGKRFGGRTLAKIIIIIINKISYSITKKNKKIPLA
jgi:hypothetical protein